MICETMGHFRSSTIILHILKTTFCTSFIGEVKKKKKKINELPGSRPAGRLCRTFPAKHNHHVVCLLSQTPKEAYVGNIPQEY